MPNYMTIPGPSDDARAVRTRQALGDALIGLMRTRAFDDITVADICEAASVGRSTFYEHFEDKEEMFIRHTVVFARGIGAELRYEPARGAYTFPVKWFFEHIRQMDPLMASLARAQKLELMHKVWQQNLAEVFEERIAATRDAAPSIADIPPELLAHQLAGTLMTLLKWWRDHHYPLSEEKMAEQWSRLTRGLK